MSGPTSLNFDFSRSYDRKRTGGFNILYRSLYLIYGKNCPVNSQIKLSKMLNVKKWLRHISSYRVHVLDIFVKNLLYLHHFIYCSIIYLYMDS